MDVRQAETDEDLEEVRRLFRSFVAWHRERHPDDLELVDASCDEADWERELAGLPGDYASPDGCLLVCLEAGLAVGAVALKRLDATSCEMKRMFVVPMARGRGAGRALADEVLRRARDAGYRSMYLDTSTRQTEAITLYGHLGFVEVEPYRDVAPQMLDRLRFFRLDL